MENTLKSRYIYAVVRHLPTKMRAEVQKELDVLISDMLEERFGVSDANEEQMKTILSELGSPEELALKYLGGEKKSLISGIYFMYYKRVLWLVLPIAAAVVAGLALLGLIFNFGNVQTPPDVLRMLLEVITAPISIVIQGFAIITIVFAFMDWKKSDLQGTKEFLDDLPDVSEAPEWWQKTSQKAKDKFNDLPKVPQSSEIIEPWRPIGSMIWIIICAILFLGFPQIVSGWFSDYGWVPLFNVEVIQSLWLPIVVWTVAHICYDIFRLIEGRYTMQLAAITAAVNTVIAICAVIIFSGSTVLNPAFIEHIGSMPTLQLGTFVFGPFENFNLFLLFIISVILVIDTGTTFYTAIRAKRRNG